MVINPPSFLLFLGLVSEFVTYHLDIIIVVHLWLDRPTRPGNYFFDNIY